MEKTEKVKTDTKTLKGVLSGFNSIQKPSVIFDKGGIYQANILISKEQGKQLAAEIKKITAEQYKKYGKGTQVVDYNYCAPYVEVQVDEDGKVVKETPDEQGRYLLKTKAKAYIKDGVADFVVSVLDSHRKPAGKVKINRGSTVVLAFTIEGYSVAGKTSVSIKLKAVQIINLAEYVQDYGFEEEEGFIADDVKATDAAETTDDNDEEEDF